MFVEKINSNKAPKAIGPYSPAVRLSDFIYFSGQLPINPETNEIVEGGIKEQTKQVLDNIVSLLSEVNLETRHIVKTTIFMQDLKEFNEMNEIYASYFNEPYPARSCVQVAALPKNAKVEIECLVIDTLNYETEHSCGGCCGGGCEDC